MSNQQLNQRIDCLEDRLSTVETELTRRTNIRHRNRWAWVALTFAIAPIALPIALIQVDSIIWENGALSHIEAKSRHFELSPTWIFLGLSLASGILSREQLAKLLISLIKASN